ncbi:MAG: UDP-glucose/GDP-mannose dehydrogenase family protein [Candidatus Thiodiazotropha lotti]|uniref:UDP-glucose 6-dehydrogenase n=1 Tax=Candidatus Thiodiazotropha endoloripes TaxID=1818881 RepID=A0A1E2UL70_9GAMM|nr:UDP-glucose/GDP-mannose dehydrogenase family protein [Candidatus Thiodiazotropha endoloripes]MCG7899346.1 UDP-glucose/GDP-mannose dehydrogenase family protein [Candidatus Thiodiazotropha weberae]MCG7992034.1 UDP-glucose/GDP-mannose dehydrogenase family protein [Candidatus Thiodiazotropha lotti]MCG7904666.1 UDP-glucose/GDP-mannose dehydrogenase family protein [Candidatus Thiodiazotropha weberae]MCG7998538.1 UDP-glucose/GDP-mannose dehydrogenase family protein [Candidatus Thiodiazotropha lotti
MKVTVFGSGYVGLVTGACLAEVGNDVVCMDVDSNKIDMLNRGEIPIYEPGLEAMVERNAQAGRLSFTTDVAKAVDHGLFQFIAVGTPPDEDGSADLQYVLAVAESIAEHMDDYRVVVDKSTVPVGTADRVRERIESTMQAKGKQVEFDVVSNPEFLKEGAALDDFMKPDRIIIGTDNPRTTELLRALYLPFNRNHDRLIAMDIRSAELTKYAANAILATKISFMNELSNLAERLGADIEQVRHGIGADTRIGYAFIYPGCGYGGSCFPKDVSALERTAKEVGYDAQLLTAVEAVNYRQKRVLFEKIMRHYSDDVKGKTFALWGLSFKPNTDDMREASSRVLMESLWEAGATVRVFDPEAMEECRRIYGERDDLVYCDNQEGTLESADALIVVTEWQVFRSPDFEQIKQALSAPVVFDGRNIYDPARMKESGFSYYAIGRGD